MFNAIERDFLKGQPVKHYVPSSKCGCVDLFHFHLIICLIKVCLINVF